MSSMDGMAPWIPAEYLGGSANKHRSEEVIFNMRVMSIAAAASVITKEAKGSPFAPTDSKHIRVVLLRNEPV